MRTNWLKNWLIRKRVIRLKIGCCSRLSVLLLLLGSQPALGISFDDVIRSFERDFSRENPLRMKSRYQSIIEDISGMKIDQDIQITFKSRGDVKQEFYSHYMKTKNLEDELAIVGYEFILKQLHLIDSGHHLKDILFDSQYNNLSGFYRPANKDLVIISGGDKQTASYVLFHELIHAAQDSTVDLNSYYDQYCTNLDASLAASALIEGHASAVEVLVNIERNEQDKKKKEILETLLEQMENNAQFQENSEEDFLSRMDMFPYFFGLKFVIQRYLTDNSPFTGMFENVPASTEQILHTEKFHNKEVPIETISQKKRASLLSLEGSELLYDTTLGEYCIREIFSNGLKTDFKKYHNAAEGWGGDNIFIFRSQGKFFFVWDTYWDTRDDAREFFECYLDFSKGRFDVEELAPSDIFNATLSKNQANIRIKKDEKRVIIFEGDIPFATFKQLKNILKP